ncbi:MAG: 2,3-bisphosphoglycerate-independent phosphoglycerate mutase [bacterium]
MDYQDLIRDLARETDSRIVMLILDGLGGLSLEKGGLTELETARTPNLDMLSSESSCGLLDPISPGITPGSGPGHLSLFGYDPVRWNMGRGVLESLGINFPLQAGDVAIRINFCTVDESGNVTDRRAGRISSAKCEELSALLDSIEVPGVEIMVRPVKEHRAVAVFRGEGLGADLNDTDPQVTGKPPLELKPGDSESERTAGHINAFLKQAREVLSPHHPANMILLRGIDSFKSYPTFYDIYKLKSAAIAQYPMYKGLARMVGMEILDGGSTPTDLFSCLEKHYDDYTFFFIHVKKTDSSGEDGDFDSKVKVIEEVDSYIPRLRELNPDAIAVTGDHSTPALLKNHSWHPLPFLVHSPYCRADGTKEFSESACAQGGMGRLPTVSLMPVLMANALKLDKFGA